VKEPDFDAMLRNRTAYLPPRFMTVNQCVAQLLEVEAVRQEGWCGPSSLAIGCARLGQPTQLIASGTLAELACVDFGGPLHSLVLCGELHDLEVAFMDTMKAPTVTEAQTQAAVEAARAEVAALVKAAPADDDGDETDSATTGEALPPPAPAVAPPPAATAGSRAAAEPSSSLDAAEPGMDDEAFEDVFGVNFAALKEGVAVVSDSDDE
jgi:hypothetical protein